MLGLVNMNENISNVNDIIIEDYHKRIGKVLEYIDNNLDSELSLEKLSEVSGFSDYHFHIVFHSLVGSMLFEYVKKRRLIAAANTLINNPSIKIADISNMYGFKGQADFSKSFKSFFGVSPFQYIKYTNTLIATETGQITVLKKSNPFFEKGISLKVLEDYTVAYIRNIGLSPEQRSKAIEASFIRLYSWANSRNLFNEDTKLMGIVLDNPEISSLDLCRYDACISVPENTQPDKEINIRKVFSEGSYVTYKFDTYNNNFRQIFFRVISYIYGFWLPQKGLLPCDKPCIKIYEKYNSCFDLYIPVKPYKI